MQSVFKGTTKTYVNRVDKCSRGKKNVVICKRMNSLSIQNTYLFFPFVLLLLPML